MGAYAGSGVELVASGAGNGWIPYRLYFCGRGYSQDPIDLSASRDNNHIDRPGRVYEYSKGSDDHTKRVHGVRNLWKASPACGVQERRQWLAGA